MLKAEEYFVRADTTVLDRHRNNTGSESINKSFLPER
jgi:hypothetical protein